MVFCLKNHSSFKHSPIKEDEILHCRNQTVPTTILAVGK